MPIQPALRLSLTAGTLLTEISADATISDLSILNHIFSGGVLGDCYSHPIC